MAVIRILGLLFSVIILCIAIPTARARYGSGHRLSGAGIAQCITAGVLFATGPLNLALAAMASASVLTALAAWVVVRESNAIARSTYAGYGPFPPESGRAYPFRRPE